MNLPLAYGLVGQALIAAAVVRLAIELYGRRAAAPAAAGDAPSPSGLRAPQPNDRRAADVPRGTPWAVMAAPLVLLVSVGDCTIAEHMRGIWGDPSIVTSAILAVFIARPGRLPERPSRATCIGLTLLVTVPLYGPVFGLALPLTDLYSLGWQPYALLAAVALAAPLMWLSGRWCASWATIMAIALLAYAVRAMESSNLLDYLADPGLLLTIAAMAALPRAEPSAQR